MAGAWIAIDLASDVSGALVLRLRRELLVDPLDLGRALNV